MNTNLRSICKMTLAGAALSLATAGHAAITANAITANALTNNALTNNALTNNGLDGQGATSARQISPLGAYTPDLSWKLPMIRATILPLEGR